MMEMMSSPTDYSVNGMPTNGSDGSNGVVKV